VFTIAVGESIKFNYNDKDIVSADARFVLARLYTGYSLIEHTSQFHKRRFDLLTYGGVRFHKVDLYSDLLGTRTLDVTTHWAEPVLGTRTSLALKKWKFILIADIGGLYIENSISYMINYNTAYRINRLLSIKFGWTVWDVKSKRDVKGDEPSLDVHLSGPAASLTFHF